MSVDHATPAKASGQATTSAATGPAATGPAATAPATTTPGGQAPVTRRAVHHPARVARASDWQQYRAVVHRALIERWRTVLGWSLGLAGIAAMQLAVYPSVASSGDSMQAMVDQWPEALQEAFGLDAYSTGPGFLNAELFSMLFPLAMTAVALTFAGGATAGEEEKGTADVLFSLPVRRVTVLAGKVTAMVLAVVAVTVCGVLTVVLGAPLVDLSVGTWEVVAGGAMTALLGLLFGAFGVLVGAVTGSRAATVGLGMCLAITAFLLNALAPLADWLEPWKDASPFSWALGGEPLTQGMDWAMAAVLLGVAVLFVLAGGVLFRRRDISSR